MAKFNNVKPQLLLPQPNIFKLLYWGTKTGTKTKNMYY